MSVRVGQGVDLHPLVAGRALVLGGVRIPYERGLAGHSDGDVCAHALCDAVLGAAGLGDLGGRFPPADEALAGASSLGFCREVAALVGDAGWTIANADLSVICPAPRLAPFVPAMVRALAGALGIGPDRLRVAPKSPEGLGALGRGEGIMAVAVCLLER